MNPLGGAIALGHPLGATGAVRTATLVHGLRRRKQKYGMVTMCIGTGMGAAGQRHSAQAGIQARGIRSWIPAFAGMTMKRIPSPTIRRAACRSAPAARSR